MVGEGRRLLARFKTLLFHGIGLYRVFVAPFIVTRCTENSNICEVSDFVLLVRAANCE